MKFKHRALTLLLSVAMMFTFMSAMAFAEEGDSVKAESKKAILSQEKEQQSSGNRADKKASGKEKVFKAKDFDDDDAYDYEGTYSGRPEIEIYDYTSYDELKYDFVINPNTSDSVKVTTDEGQKIFKWLYDEDAEGYYFEVENDPDDWLEIEYVYLNEPDNTQASIEVNNYVINEAYDEEAYDEEDEDTWYYRYNWTAYIPISSFRIINSVKSISFQPSTIYLVAEDIINFDEGMPYYDFWKRSTHSLGGSTWTSPYAVGDTVTVNYTNGISQKFKNVDLRINEYDDEGYYQGYYYDDYFSNNEKFFWLYRDNGTYNDELVLGRNTFTLYWHGASTKVTVIVETAAQKTARERAEAAKRAEEAAKRAEEARKAIKTVTVNTSTVTAASINNAITAAGGSTAYVTTIILGKNVKKISKKAFKDTNVTSLEIKTTKLKEKKVKGALKGSKIKTIRVPKKLKKAYKKIFSKKIAGKKVSIK